MELKYKIKHWLQTRFFCAFNLHEEKGSEGQPANFCGACGIQLNPDAYKKYRVVLNDNSRQYVVAVNEQHARSLVMYGQDSRVFYATGNPVGEQLVHPNNIQSVREI